jgi:transcription elongation GreA/GreB family factor
MPNFELIESMFSKFLIASSSELSDSERAEIQEFVDVGEYGLALETAADIYAEEKKTLTADVALLMEKLALAMSMDPGSIFGRLARMGSRPSGSSNH